MLIIIITILLISYLLEIVLDFLNIRNWKLNIPSMVREVYTEKKYQKAREYALVNFRLTQVTSLIGIIIMLNLLNIGGFGLLDEYVRGFTDSPVIVAILFFLILGFASDLLSLPFSIYKTFVIEEKFGFNNTSVKTFIFDKLKGYLLMIIIGTAFITILVKIYEFTGINFWWIVWIIFTVLIFLMMFFYTTWILPIFNKLTPLEEGGLRNAIQDYCIINNFPFKNIFVMNGSKRSSKANAFFSGLGTKKKIVLYDTLIKEYSTSEVVAVLAHETGHYKLKHTQTGFIAGILQTGIMLFIFSLLQGNPQLIIALGAKQAGLHLEFLTFALLYSPASVITGILMHLFSRKNEYEADAYAKKTYNGKALSSALIKLSSDSLSNLTPHPAFVFVHYSHPPLLKRLEALERN